jgi:hypothetical protein
LLCGTSDGVFQLQGLDLTLVHSTPGYVDLDTAKGTWSVSNLSVPGTDKANWINLLPPSQSSDYGTHAVVSPYFYLVINGKMKIYQLTNYKKSYSGKSIRSISKSHVATYSGVYLGGERIRHINHSSGYTREFDTVTFVCHDGLLMVTNNDTINFQSPISKRFVFLGESFGFARDIVPLSNHNYLIFTTIGLYEVNFKEPQIKQIAECSVCPDGAVFMGQMEETLFIGLGKDIYTYVLGKEVFKFYATTNYEIQAGAVAGFDVYVLHQNQLIRLDISKKQEVISEFSAAHSLSLGFDTCMFVSTNKGLFVVNLKNNKKTELIANVEFNKRAIYLENKEKLHVGSMWGLFTILLPVDDVFVDSFSDSSALVGARNQRFQQLFLAVLLAIAGIGVLWNVFLKNTRSRKEEINEINLSLPRIESFIEANIANVSIALICSHFNVSTNQLYQALFPQKPGALIHNVRMAKVIELQKQGKELDEIAKTTGFSNSYLKKIIHKLPTSV